MFDSKIDRAINTILKNAELFECDFETSYKKYTHDAIKKQYSYEDLMWRIKITNPKLLGESPFTYLPKA